VKAIFGIAAVDLFRAAGARVAAWARAGGLMRPAGLPRPADLPRPALAVRGGALVRAFGFAPVDPFVVAFVLVAGFFFVGMRSARIRERLAPPGRSGLAGVSPP
jgi:hypothetical protein